MVVIMDFYLLYFFIITFLINFRRFKYGIPLYYSYFISDYNNSLCYNFYSIFNSIKVVEF